MRVQTCKKGKINETTLPQKKTQKVDFFPANSSIQILFQMKTETNLVAAGVHGF